MKVDLKGTNENVKLNFKIMEEACKVHTWLVCGCVCACVGVGVRVHVCACVVCVHTVQVQRLQAAPTLPMALIYSLQSPREDGLTQLVKCLQHCTVLDGLDTECACVYMCMCVCV